MQVDGELEALLENGEGLSDKNQVLSLSRLMVRIETLEQKLTCLKLIQVRSSPGSGRDSRPAHVASSEEEGECGRQVLPLFQHPKLSRTAPGSIILKFYSPV